MAGDWIPIRIELVDDPDVMGIAKELGIRREQVVGHLLRLWGWASTHTTDGHAPGVTDVTLDALKIALERITISTAAGGNEPNQITLIHIYVGEFSVARSVEGALHSLVFGAITDFYQKSG